MGDRGKGGEEKEKEREKKVKINYQRDKCCLEFLKTSVGILPVIRSRAKGWGSDDGICW